MRVEYAQKEINLCFQIGMVLYQTRAFYDKSVVFGFISDQGPINEKDWICRWKVKSVKP